MNPALRDPGHRVSAALVVRGPARAPRAGERNGRSAPRRSDEPVGDEKRRSGCPRNDFLRGGRYSGIPRFRAGASSTASVGAGRDVMNLAARSKTVWARLSLWTHTNAVHPGLGTRQRTRGSPASPSLRSRRNEQKNDEVSAHDGGDGRNFRYEHRGVGILLVSQTRAPFTAERRGHEASTTARADEGKVEAWLRGGRRRGRRAEGRLGPRERRATCRTWRSKRTPRRFRAEDILGGGAHAKLAGATAPTRPGCRPRRGAAARGAALRGTDEPWQPKRPERLASRTPNLEALVRGMDVRGLSTPDVGALDGETWGETVEQAHRASHHAAVAPGRRDLAPAGRERSAGGQPVARWAVSRGSPRHR